MEAESSMELQDGDVSKETVLEGGLQASSMSVHEYVRLATGV
jgi:hypothetical protein